jgi:hypothetical protein
LPYPTIEFWNTHEGRVNQVIRVKEGEGENENNNNNILFENETKWNGKVGPTIRVFIK